MMADEEVEYYDDEEEFEEEQPVVGQLPTAMVPRHIKKRSLKNKALAVEFSDKALRDFVTGFHKRKKKRRKEAQLQLQEKERLKRIRARKKRKEEKEVALYGRVLSSENPIENSGKDDVNDREDEPDGLTTLKSPRVIFACVSREETKTYDHGNVTITVTTSELSCKDDVKQPSAPKMSTKAEKSHGLSVKKKPMKRVAKHRSKKGGKKKNAKKKKDNSKSGKRRH